MKRVITIVVSLAIIMSIGFATAGCNDGMLNGNETMAIAYDEAGFSKIYFMSGVGDYGELFPKDIITRPCSYILGEDLNGEFKMIIIAWIKSQGWIEVQFPLVFSFIEGMEEIKNTKGVDYAFVKGEETINYRILDRHDVISYDFPSITPDDYDIPFFIRYQYKTYDGEGKAFSRIFMFGQKDGKCIVLEYNVDFVKQA